MSKKKNYILISDEINNNQININEQSILVNTLKKTDKKIFEKFNEYEFDINNTFDFDKNNTNDFDKNNTNDFDKINNNNNQNYHTYDVNTVKKISDDVVLNNAIESDIINTNKFNKKEKMLFEVLNNFYNKCDIKEIELVIEIIDGNHKVSLRFLDWFVTRYCYLYKLSINVNTPHIKNQETNINISYRAQLKSVGKKKFDPFRRNKKFFYNFGCHDICILTTLGQLNFFKWVLSYGIINYVNDNFDIINEKINHVNMHFKKHIIDSNSLSITTSDDNISNKKCNFESDEKSEISKFSSDTMTKTSLSSISELSQSDISFLMGTDVKKTSMKIIKPSKKFNDLKNSQKISKYPQVIRNICIEF